MSHVEHLAEGVTLYLGDMEEILPTLQDFDVCLTDPPYGTDYGRAGSFSHSHGWGDWRENVEWDAERPPREIFDLIRSKTKRQIIWGGNYFTDFLPPTMQWLVWDKGQRDFSLADCEFAWSSQWNAARIFSFSRSLAKQDGKVHPTQKPIELMSWCLDQLRPIAKSVVDPFSGSFTTAISCIRRGVSFVGIEKDEAYFEAGVERVRSALLQPDMFIESPKPVKQEAFI